MPAGDVELTELVADRDQRYRLESEVQYGGGALDGLTGAAIPTALLGRLDGLRRFARAVASAARLPASRLVPAHDGPDTLLRGDGLVIVAGVGVYAAHETGTASRSGSLRAWAAGPLERWTAFHSMYLDAPPPDVGDDGDSAAVESPHLLTPVQERAVVSSRRDPVTLISGAPGTGKSHTVVAIACDALARGESVLVAAKSDATVDALLGLLERAPGPDPVVFGSNERREALAARLAAGQLQPLGDDRVARAHDERTRARSAEASLTSAVLDPPPGAPSASPWVEEVTDSLRSGGVPVITSYPCGRHLIDICIERPGDVAIQAAVHRDGPDAHVERHLALIRSGWTVLEAFPSRWSERRGELIVDLLARVGAPSTAP